MLGLSHTGVQRIWAAHGLKPHLTESFKLSNDPHFKTVFNDWMLELDLIGSYRFNSPYSVVFAFSHPASQDGRGRMLSRRELMSSR